MDLSPYLESLRRELAATLKTGTEEVRRAGELLTGALEPSARLCLMEALSDAAEEVTAKLGTASVEVRLRGRDADLVVTDLVTEPDPAPAPTGPSPTGSDGSGEVARITLRLPEELKEAVERAASGEGISVNAWLVRAIGAAVSTRPPGWASPRPGGTYPPTRPGFARRVTGFAQA